MTSSTTLLQHVGHVQERPECSITKESYVEAVLAGFEQAREQLPA